MRKGGSRCGVRDVIRRDVDGLHRGDGSSLGGGDPLLQLPHLCPQGRLVAHGRGHPAQEGRDLGARLGEAKDIINEQQDVLSLFISEVFGRGEAREAYPKPGSRWLGHLTIDQGGFVDDLAGLHLEPQVIPLSGPLSDASKDRNAPMLHGDVADQLHDEDGLAHSCTPEEASLASPRVGFEQIDHLDPRLHHGRLGCLLFKGGGLSMNGIKLFRVYLPEFVHRLPDDVQDPAQRGGTDGDLNACTGVDDLLAPDESISPGQGDAPNLVLPQMQGHFQRQLLGVREDVGVLHPRHLDGIVNRRQMPGSKLTVHHRPNHLSDPSLVHRHSPLFSSQQLLSATGTLEG